MIAAATASSGRWSTSGAVASMRIWYQLGWTGCMGVLLAR